MNAQALPYVAPLLVAAVLVLAMLAVALPQRSLPGVRWFLVFMVGVVVWTLAYAGEIVLPGLDTKLLTAKVQYLGIALVPCAWLAFTIEYSGATRVRYSSVAALVAFPIATIAVAWTNEFHGLLYRETALTTGAAFQVLDITRGVWFWANIAYAYGCLLVATGLLVRMILLRPPLFRRQASLLLVAGLTPWMGNVVYVSGLNPVDLDPTVFGFAISGLLAGWAILRWRLLSIGPIGRDTIVEGLEEAVAVIDNEGRVVDVNRAGVDVFGRDIDELVGHEAADVLGHFEPEFDPDEGNRRTVRGLDGERSYDRQINPLHDAGGRLRGWTMVLFDVTERAARAAALERAREVAEETARSQRHFLTNMNHELRTPLNGVLGMLDVLSASPLTPEQRQHVEMAHASGEDLLELVNQILDFTKLDEGRLELASQRFDFVTTVREVVEEYRPRAQDRGLRFVFSADPDIPVWSEGDPERTHQVMEVLVSNALRFTEEGEVRVELTLQSRTREEAEVLVQVSDTGIGIRAERLEEIFKPLTQVDASNTRRHQGAGLGLTIADRIVTAMGGALRVESEVGVGSTFSFSLKLALPAAERVASAPRMNVEA